MEIAFTPKFVKTKNVQSFCVMMDGIALSAGEGRLAMVCGRAGRGKTRTCQWWHAQHGGIYLRMATVWRTSELYFLQALCRELEIMSPPGRKGPAFAAVVDALIERPRPVFLDEIEKLPRFFLDLVRDLADLSTAPFILIGEEELSGYMKQNRRVWSRTCRQLVFDPIKIQDIMVYSAETTGLKLSPSVAGVFHAASDGDFRIVRRDLINLVQWANAKGTRDIGEELAKIAVSTGLSGR